MSESVFASRALLRHYLAAMAYRTRKTLDGAPDGFGAFQAGEGVRTPLAILTHMSQLVAYTLSSLREVPPERLEPADDLEAEWRRFRASLAALSAHLKSDPPLRPETVDRIVQGPLADAMTHVGQLALLRRLAGSPLLGENYFEAEIAMEDLAK